MFSETSVHTRSTRRHIPEDGIVSFSVHKRHILSQINPIRAHAIVSICVVILILYQCLCLSSRLFPSDFQSKIVQAFLISPKHGICPFHLILLDMITLIIFILMLTYNYKPREEAKKFVSRRIHITGMK
jgi:hypothetical protein